MLGLTDDRENQIRASENVQETEAYLLPIDFFHLYRSRLGRRRGPYRQVELRGDLTTGGDPKNNPPAENPPTNTGYTTQGTLTNTAVQAQNFQFGLTANQFQADVLSGSLAALTAAVALVPSGTVLLQQTYLNVPANGSVTWGPRTLNSTTLTQTFSSPADLAQFVGSGSFGYSASTAITQALLGGAATSSPESTPQPASRSRSPTPTIAPAPSAISSGSIKTATASRMSASPALPA